MAENKKNEHKSEEKKSSWQEHQKKYASNAKEMFENFSKNFQNPSVHKEAMMANHNKNLDALSDSNRMAIEVLKSIAKLQSDYIKQTFEDMNHILRESIKNNSKDHQAHAKKIQETMHRSLDHSINIGSVMANSHKEIHSRLHDRIREGMEEIRIHKNKFKH